MFLKKKRSEQQEAKEPIENAAFTVEDISKAINEDFDFVDEQLNVLYVDEMIGLPGSQVPPIFVITGDGVALASTKKLLNDGKALNSQLFNNYASGAFQILIGCIAIYTIYNSVTSIKEVRSEINSIKLELESTSEYLIKLEERVTTQESVVGKMEDYQTSSQNDSIKADSLE